MDGLRTFYETLGSAERDAFVQMVSESSMTIAPVVKEGVERRLKEVVLEINRVNAEREMLGNKANRLADFAEKLQEFMNNNRNYAIEIVLIKKFFSLAEDNIRQKMSDLKPDSLLKEKYALKSKLREMSDDLASFSKINHVLHLIIKKKEQDDVQRKQSITVE